MKQLKIIGLSFVGLLVVLALILAKIWFQSALNINQKQYFRIKENDNLDSLTIRLEKENGLKSPYLFKKIALKMNLPRWIKKGRYELDPDMNMRQLVKLFREGRNKTVNFTIRPLSTLSEFAMKCGEKLEPDTEQFKYLLNDSIFLDSLGFNTKTIYALLLPDTYNLYWHTEPDELFQRLLIEYNLFWNEQRIKKANAINLTPIEVSILASIVDKETNKVDEMPVVAGLYLNRLKINMKLESDPTVKFAVNQPELKRILNEHLIVPSPYNTYLNLGLPPGPICIPSKQAIESVLNAQENDYLFMCAKEDFSGYHNFSSQYSQHLIFAKNYRKALDLLNIK